MRVLALTNLYPNPLQPHRATFNRQQLRALAGRHAVAVIAPVAWTDELAARWKGAGRLPVGRRAVTDGIAVEHPRYLYPPSVLRGWYGHFYRRSVRPAFERALSEFRPDLVFAPWAYPDGWAAVELGHRAGLPVVIKVHGTDVLGLGPYPGRLRRTSEALTRADGVVAVSRDLAGRVPALGADPSRVHVVYDGVDLDRFHPGPADEARRRLGQGDGPPIVLFIGNLVPVKGLDTLLGALSLLKREGVPFACRLIGQGPLRGALGREVVRRGLTGVVEFLGPRPHDQLPDWYRAASVFVLPSRSEGVPTVLLEAVACGTRFVASAVGGVPEVDHRGLGRLVPPGEPAPLARALRDALGEPPGARAGGATVSRSHDDAVSDLENVFDGVLRVYGRGRPSGEEGPPPASACSPPNGLRNTSR